MAEWSSDPPRVILPPPKPVVLYCPLCASPVTVNGCTIEADGTRLKVTCNAFVVVRSIPR